MASSGGQTAFVWTGFDRADVHQDARLLRDGALEPVAIVPLPPTNPLDQRLIPGTSGAFHLLWRDRPPQEEALRLYSAWLGADLSVERGPVEISTAPTYAFTALADGSGGAWIAWSQGHPVEPEVWLGRLDAAGRPQQLTLVATNANYPALTHAPDGTPQLYWESEGQLWRASLTPEGTEPPAALTGTVGRRSGDVLNDLWAAPCGAQVCVGWNLTRGDGQAETWLTSGPAAIGQWNVPHRLEGLSWVSPNADHNTSEPELSAAAGTAEGLAVVRLRDGAVTARQVAVQGVALSGLPGFIETGTTRTVTWAEPGPDYAQLLLWMETLPNAP